MKKIFSIIGLLISLNSFSQSPVELFHSNNTTSAADCTYDCDAETWFTAAGITDATFKTAASNLFVAAKSHGWYSTKIAMWCTASGDATKSKYNMINPVDDDAHYRLTTTGGVTYATTGATGNGFSGYLDTHLVPSATSLTTTSGYFSVYIRTNINESKLDMGCEDAGGNNSTLLAARYGGTAYGEYGNNSFTNGTSSASSAGYWAIIRDGGINYMYKNGSSIVSTTESAVVTGKSIYIMSVNTNGSPNTYSLKEFGFATVGTKLTSTQANNEYNDVLTFLTAIGAN